MIRLNDVNAELQNMFDSYEISREYVKIRKQIENTKQKITKSENIVTEKTDMAQNYSMFNKVLFKTSSIFFKKFLYVFLVIPSALFLAFQNYVDIPRIFTSLKGLNNFFLFDIALELIYWIANFMYFLLLGFFFAAILCLIFSLVLAGIVHLVTIKYQKKKKVHFLSEVEIEKSNIISYEQELTQLDSALKQCSDTLNATSVVPEMYWQYIEELCNIVYNRRANDLMSAINVLEDILYKIRMEDAQLKQINMLRCNSEELEKIKSKINDISVRVYVNNRI